MKMLTTPTTWMRKQHVTMTSLMQTFQNTQPAYYKINHIYSRNQYFPKDRLTIQRKPALAKGIT